MNAYFTFTGTSLRRRPSLFPGTRSPSEAREPHAQAPSVEPAPKDSTPVHPQHDRPATQQPNYPMSEPPNHSPAPHPRSVETYRSPREQLPPETRENTSHAYPTLSNPICPPHSSWGSQSGKNRAAQKAATKTKARPRCDRSLTE